LAPAATRRVIVGSMAHPYAELLKDRPVRVLWTGLATSQVGSELYRVGAIWLAARLAGPRASLLITAEAGAVLAVSILMGPLIEALPRRLFLVGAEIVAALASAAVVAVAFSVGLSFPVLVVAGMTLASLAALVRPVVLSSLPHVSPGRIREVNGLFDSTIRLAQAVGPMLAAAAMKVVPAIHLLTANSLSFLASATAWLLVGARLDAGTRPKPSGEGFLRRLGRGVRAANACPGAWSVLAATGVRGGGYALGNAVAVPVLFAQGGGAGGLGAVALIFGTGAATELIATPLLVLTRPARPLQRLFEGYMLIGTSVAAMGFAATLSAPWQIPGMCAAAVVLGVGNSVATLQITTFLASRLSSDDYAAILRLRLVTIIGSTMAATAAGPLVLAALGPPPTIVVCGLAAAAAGLAGRLGAPARAYGPGFETA
jgi:hypothetical protein